MPVRKNLLDSDLTKFPAVVYLALVFLISRAPFIDLGFSAFTSPTDQDVLAVVNSAYLLRYFHVYTVSRFPGYPFFEIINSLLIGGGWLFTNLATVMFSFTSLILFGKILNVFGVKNKALLLLTFAFIPVVWINSTITMDYMWGLAFILLSCFLVFTGKYSSGGIAIGFAIATRFTSAFMVIPLLYWMLIKKVDAIKVKRFLITGILTSTTMFLPVLYKYNLGFLQGSGFLYTTPVRSFDSMLNSLFLSAMNLVTELTGLPAFILIIFAMLFLKKSVHVAQHEHIMNFCWIVVMLYGIIYFIFPYKVAYLIPVIPWGLIILNQKLHKSHLVAICILLILNNIISINFENEEPHKINSDSGVILKNYYERAHSGIDKSEDYMESLSDALRRESEMAVRN